MLKIVCFAIHMAIKIRSSASIIFFFFRHLLYIECALAWILLIENHPATDPIDDPKKVTFKKRKMPHALGRRHEREKYGSDCEFHIEVERVFGCG